MDCPNSRLVVRGIFTPRHDEGEVAPLTLGGGRTAWPLARRRPP